MARAGRALAGAYIVGFCVVAFLAFRFDLARGNVAYPHGFPLAVKLAFVPVCVLWIEALLDFPVRHPMERPRPGQEVQHFFAMLFFALAGGGLALYFALREPWARWAFLACGAYWVVRFVMLRRVGRGRGASGTPAGSGPLVQVPVLLCLLALGLWAFVFTNYHAAAIAIDVLNRDPVEYRARPERYDLMGGLIDFGTCRSVVVAIDRAEGVERFEICREGIRIDAKLERGDPVLVRGRTGVAGLAVDRIERPPPGAGGLRS